MSRRKESPFAVISFAANVLILGAVVAALYVAQGVFIPLTLATLLAFLLAPLADRLEARRLGRIPAVIVIALVAFTIISGFVWIVGREATKLAANIPQYQTEIVSKVENFSSLGSSTSKRMMQLVTAVTRALRGGSDGSTDPSEFAAEVQGPVNELDPKGSLDVAQDSADAGADPSADPGTADNPLHVVSTDSRSTPAGTAGTILGALVALLSPLTNVGLVFVFTIFMLVSRDDLRDRMIRVLSGGRYIVTTKAIDEASRRISSYILAQTIVNSLYGLCIGLGLWLIGVTLGGGEGFPNFALWGLLCTVLRFVPYVGPIIAGAIPVLLSLIVYPGFAVFAATSLLFVVIELISNNVIEPWLYGSSTGMSPMAVIIAAVFWTWMWGPVGLLLATPLTASLVVLGKYVPQLRALTVLLGDKTPLPPFVSFYQRLLADDSPRAAKILEAVIEETDVETAADDVLLPTIRRIRRDRARDELNSPREHRLMQQITEMIDGVLASHCKTEVTKQKGGDEAAKIDIDAGTRPNDADSVEPAEANSIATSLECNQRVAKAVTDEPVGRYTLSDDQPEHFDVVGCTSHHESEEPALKLLAYCLSEHNIEMRWAGTRALPTDVEDWIEKIQPKVIVIAIVPPGGFVQAKYMCERLHERLPHAQIIVAFFGKLLKYDASLVKFRRIGASYVTTSLNQTRIQIISALNESPIAESVRRKSVAAQSSPAKSRGTKGRGAEQSLDSETQSSEAHASGVLSSETLGLR